MNVRYDVAKKSWRISSNILGYTGPIFVILSPYESALGADGKSGRCFPIWQWTLSWQPNNVALMILHAFFARSPDDSSVLDRYYLLGGDY